jgi:hypothetical protein
MKTINRVFVMITIVLGVGTTASASANNSRIEDSLKHVIVKQSQQINERLTQQLQHTINVELNNTVLNALPIMNRDITTVKITNKQLVSKRQLINTTSMVNTTTEEE